MVGNSSSAHILAHSESRTHAIVLQMEVGETFQKMALLASSVGAVQASATSPPLWLPRMHLDMKVRVHLSMKRSQRMHLGVHLNGGGHDRCSLVGRYRVTEKLLSRLGGLEILPLGGGSAARFIARPIFGRKGLLSHPVVHPSG